MTANLLVSKKIISIILIFIFATAADISYAEYYLSCSGPDYVECVNCGKQRVIPRHHKHYKRHKHRPCVRQPVRHIRHSQVKMQVYYVWNVFTPPCACDADWVPANCGCTVKSSRPTGSFVEFSGKPTPMYDYGDESSYRVIESSYFYDRGTADDDSYVYPDMNIDH